MAQTRFSNATLKKLGRGDWIDPRYPNLVFRVGERARTWLFRLPRRPDGSRPGLKLGSFPGLDLESAVKAYEIERGRVARNEPLADPDARIRELKAELAALERLVGGLVTFKAFGGRFLDEYLPKTGKPLTKTVHKAYGSLLERYAYPAWGDRDVRAIEEGEIEAVIAEVRRATPVAANSLLKVLKTMYSWGMRKKLVTTNPCAFIAKLPENNRTRVLQAEEIRAAWNAFSGLGSARISRALKLTLVTMQRRSEVAGMEWSEIGGEWWTLPASRSKNGEPNMVYLPSLARDLLEAQRADATDCRFVFPGIRKRSLPLLASHLTVECGKVSAALLEAGKIRAGFTVHDLRRTGATTVRSNGAQRGVVQRILNHKSRTVTDIYDLYGMKPEIESVFTEWGHYLTDLLEIRPTAG